MDATTTEDTMPRYMLLQKYEECPGCSVPMNEWSPEDIDAHTAFQHMMNDELIKRGELVEANGLAGPESAKTVLFDGVGAPIVTDGPYAEGKELLAGYRMIDVDSEARALEIAAQASAAPGPNGVPIQQPIEVREVMGAPTSDS
jgi:hypothetical protein